MRPSLAIYLLIIALAASLWLPNLFTYGMFMDGVVNASVAKLYAEGTGSFFNLQERYYANGTYAGHPPLAFALQALFFKLFGSGFYMDKLYSLLCAIGQLLLIKLLWQQVAPRPQLKHLAWLPCLLWLLSPIISWGYSSNLLENTMSLFTTASLITMLGYMRSGSKMWLYAIMAAVFTMCGVLCKGPVALFVLAAPLVFVNAYDGYNLRKAMAFLAVYIATLSLFALAVGLLPEGNAFIKAYFQEQLKPSLSTNGSPIWARLKLLPFLLKALIPMIALVAVAWGITQTKLLRNFNIHIGGTVGYRFLLLGLCATLPIMLSNKQSAFYVIPAIPVFAIGFALLITNVVMSLEEKYARPALGKAGGWLSLAVIGSMVGLSIYNYGSVLRDADKLSDAAQINKLLESDRVLTDPNYQFAEEYHFKAYLNRLYNISVYTDTTSKWYLGKQGNNLPEGAKIVYQGKWALLYSY